MNKSDNILEFAVFRIRTHSPSIIILGLLLLIFLAPASQADTVTWDGGGGDGLWSNRLNWSNDALPLSTDNISINAGAGEVHLDIDFTLEGGLGIGVSFPADPDTLIIDSGVTFTNNGPSGAVGVNRTGTLINNGVIRSNGPTTLSFGEFNIGNGGSFTNNNVMERVRLAVDNSTFGESRFTNNGAMSEVSARILWGTFDNNGSFDHAQIVTAFNSPTRRPIINNNATGTIDTTPTALLPSPLIRILNPNDVFNNYGTLTNATSIENWGVFTNFGTVNTTAGFFDNRGTFVSECDSILLGTISVNPPVEVVCDTTPPVITVPADITAEATSQLGAFVSYTATAEDDTDGAITPTCMPVSGSSFGLGVTTVTCSATDAAGNTASASFTVEVVDTTPPDTAILSAVDGNSNSVTSFGSTLSTSITFTFEGTDVVGVDRFECSLDGAAFTTCVSPKSFNSLAATGHTFEVRAVDTADNTDDTPASFEWTVLTSVQAIRNLIAYIEALDLPGGTKNALLGPLKQATRILTDRYTQNDNAACGKLDEFLTTVDEKEAASQLTSGQALQLRQAARAIKVNEGCP